MVQVLEAPPVEDNGALRVLMYDDDSVAEFVDQIERDDEVWGPASRHATTIEAARALHASTEAAPESPEFTPDDGLGP